MVRVVLSRAQSDAAMRHGSVTIMAEDQPSSFTKVTPRLALTPMPEGSFEIVVAEGRDKGARLIVDGTSPSRLLIGTSPTCDFRLTDPEVSRRHAALEIVGSRLRVTDLGSSNGTTVGDLGLVDGFLDGGTSIRIGSTVLVVERETSARAVTMSQRQSFGSTIGVSREMRRLYPLCEKLAASDIPVILEGETGTGKEVLAESIHEEGPRKDGPFIVFDCTAVPSSLVESELFGHERGAFTGAVAARKGVFEEADGGTLLIDEIGDLALDLQPKLLRALERSEIRRVGGNKWLKVNVRVLAATRRDLDAEVQQGRFRDDLFHRLAVARIELPPLRKRRGDISLLVEHFAKQLKGDHRQLTKALLAQWEGAPWPGNVRELRNAVARRLALGELASERGETMGVPLEESDSGDEGLPPTVAAVDDTVRQEREEIPVTIAEDEPRGSDDLVAEVLALNLPLVQARERLVHEFEARYVAHVLAQHNGNVTHAAAASGVARRHFQRVKKRTA